MESSFVFFIFYFICLKACFPLSYSWLHWVFTAARAFSSCGKLGVLVIVVRGLLSAVASLVAEHGLQVHKLQPAAHRPSRRGTHA